MIHCRLVKGGYGTLREVKEFSAKEVLDALGYEVFLAEYEETFVEINK